MLDFHLKLVPLAVKLLHGERQLSHKWCMCPMVFLSTLNVMRAVSIVFETSSAQKGGHFFLRQYMWDVSGWSDLSAVK